MIFVKWKRNIGDVSLPLYKSHITGDNELKNENW
jgi:hypothetical protein